LERTLRDRTIKAVEQEDGDLYLTLDGGVRVRIGIRAQYCDYAWLVLEGLRDADTCLWEYQAWD
jgi:hypothetical protein